MHTYSIMVTKLQYMYVTTLHLHNNEIHHWLNNHATVLLKRNVTLARTTSLQMILTNLLIKGHGTHFFCEYSSRFVLDKYSQRKWVPRPLISEFFNCLQSNSASKCDITFEWYRMFFMYCPWLFTTHGPGFTRGRRILHTWPWHSPCIKMRCTMCKLPGVCEFVSGLYCIDTLSM